MINQLFFQYFNQPNSLPLTLHKLLAESIVNERIYNYACVDLLNNLTFGNLWVIVTDNLLIIAEPSKNVPEDWQLKTIPLLNIHQLKLIDYISTQQLKIIGEKEEIIAKLHFTRRQSRSIVNLRYAALRRREALYTETNISQYKNSSPEKEYQESVLYNLRHTEGLFFISKINVMWRLISYLKPYKRKTILGVILGIFITILLLLPPYLISVLVDDILKPIESGNFTKSAFWLWLIIIGLASVWLVSEISTFFRLRITSFSGEKIASKLRLDLYEHMQRLSLSFFSSNSAGSLITRSTSDIDKISEFFTFGFIDIGIAILQIIGIAIALLVQDWSLALLVLLPLPIIGTIFYRHGKLTQLLYIRLWRKKAYLTSILSEVIPGIRVVQAFAQEEQELLRFKGKNENLKDETIELHEQWSKFWPTVSMLMHMCSLIVWVIGAPRVLLYIQTGGSEGLPLGTFIAFTGYMWSFWSPVQQLGIQSRGINKVIISASRVFEILDTVPTIVSKPEALKLNPLKGEVSFEHVTFSYNGILNAIEDLSFQINPGEMIGLIGPSGSGKTTLVNLICRFYDATSGVIKIDGVDIRELDIINIRKQIGVVLQEPYLFSGTIAENIAYGMQEATPQGIIEAAKAANAHEFICNLPYGYETLVGDRGLTLSGGERQRISIARAILCNPRILILDEATSSVDTDNEKKIQEALQHLTLGRTTFAIAHRLSTLKTADRLFVMENGKLSEHGTHEELVKQPNSFYARILQTQFNSY